MHGKILRLRFEVPVFNAVESLDYLLRKADLASRSSALVRQTAGFLTSRLRDRGVSDANHASSGCSELLGKSR